MSRIIRKALLQRLRESPKLAELQADFLALANVRLNIAGPTGEPLEAGVTCGDSPLCQWVQSTSAGRDHCRRAQRNAAEAEGASEVTCDAGLAVLAVPLRAAGQTIGSLTIGGYRVGTFGADGINRLRHLLSRMGLEDDLDEIRTRTGGTHLLERRAQEALRRWLTIAADDLAESIDLRLDHRDRPLPAAVSKVCAWIQREFERPIRLSEAACLSGLSEGHFSRLFHESTGLRFVEYVNETRLDEARRLLSKPDLPVTEAAFASGFQSLSQFNRLFRRSTGKTPGEWRRAHLSPVG